MIKMVAGQDQRRKKAAGNTPMTAPSTDLIDSNDLASDDVPNDKDLVRCFCGNGDEFREMASCDVCSGWVSLSMHAIERKHGPARPKGFCSLFLLSLQDFGAFERCGMPATRDTRDT